MTYHSLRPRPSVNTQPSAGAAHNRPRSFASPRPRSEAVRQFIFDKQGSIIEPHSWRARTWERQPADPVQRVRPGTVNLVDPNSAWQKTSRGYRTYRPLIEPESLGGRMARETCVFSAAGLGSRIGSRIGPYGGFVGGALGTAFGVLGCDSAGNLMVPYFEPGLSNISPRVDDMGNTISPHP